MSRNRMSVRRISGPRSTRLLLPAVVAGLLLSATPVAHAAGAPANDSFANATVLQASSGSITSTNVGVTTQAGEQTLIGRPAAASVWFSWTPTVSGRVIFRTQNSAFDTVLAALVGSTFGQEVLAGADDDATFAGTFTHQSRITFDAKAGTTAAESPVDAWASAGLSASVR